MSAKSRLEKRFCWRRIEGGRMLEVDENIGGLVAAETKGALRAIDNAILSELRLCATLIEALDQTALPVGSSQKLLQNLANGINHFVAGRSEMATTIKTLTAIKAGSTTRETNYNCPGQLPMDMVAEQTAMRQPCSETVFGG
jgi:hypothetical protein